MKSILITILSSVLKQLIKVSPPSVVKNNLQLIAEKIERYDDSFFTYHLRPKKSNNYLLKNNWKPAEKVAIVVQGPLCKEESFTFETIKLYKKNFPDALVIISTWDTEDSSLIKSISKQGVEVVTTSPPKIAGAAKINLQVASTMAGLNRAKELGAQYVFKSRTDQRMGGVNISEAFIGLLKVFPVKNECLKMRLISVNFTTLKYRLFGVGDMLMFGNINDMLTYWNADLDKREIDRHSIGGKNIEEYSKLRLGESYLCANFLERIGYQFDWTLQDSWKVYRDFFCVVDKEMVDLYWLKYGRFVERRNDYYAPHSQQIFKFTDWLSFYNSGVPGKIDDKVILSSREGGFL